MIERVWRDSDRTCFALFYISLFISMYVCVCACVELVTYPVLLEFTAC